MGATIFYRVVERSNDSLSVSTPSSFVSAMERAFGSQPWKLDEKDLATLRGMEATTATGSLSEVNPFQQIINLIEDGKSIEVWPEY